MNEDEDREELGEQLYHLISPEHPDTASKLTGMLLELPVSVVRQMLQDEILLNEGLNRALNALHLNVDSQAGCEVASASSDSLGERLYDLIELHNTGHTHKVTGMLLEQQKEAVLQLLSDPALLEQKISLALKTLHELADEETNVSENSDRDEDIGETLFALVKQVEPTHCADITGMLLEMESESLNQILRSRAMLEVAVQKAKTAMEGIWDK
ncbi:uncharacterized protein LOC114786890 isoform X2 [Denticeps clupeoides]|uniref:PABC domain-containing protein n=1 Tax=Denticeps clupeoides TaxID=299321 RepID=A0AAY4A3V1_9TELE|nr:uncharacterized protein LOC114786890 isoform X2 [Denticeps clupeoides]